LVICFFAFAFRAAPQGPDFLMNLGGGNMARYEHLPIYKRQMLTKG